MLENCHTAAGPRVPSETVLDVLGYVYSRLFDMDPSAHRSALVAAGGPDQVLTTADCIAHLTRVLDGLAPRRVLLLPPDYTRFHSGVGELTVACRDHLRAAGAETDIMPALGTHAPMSERQIGLMFPGLDPAEVLPHDWRNDLCPLGVIPGSFVAEVSGGLVDYDIQIAVNRRVAEGGYDLILSLGQVVPHEVIGLANQNKNLFVGVGGSDIINKSHFLGAVCGMERVMGRPDSPVRRVFNRAAELFCADLPICYALTVRQQTPDGLVTRGLFVGDDAATFAQAARLSQQVNLDLLDRPLAKVVVWLDPEEFHSTWLGNKAVYRTRMAMADGGELVILAPGLREFGEDAEIDRLIRAYGYRGTPTTLAAVAEHHELRANLSAAAHLIHGSSEGRFTITYAPGGLSREEIEGVGYQWAELAPLIERYQPQNLRDGYNTLPDGEEVFFISNPALGLWAPRSAFED